MHYNSSGPTLHRLGHISTHDGTAAPFHVEVVSALTCPCAAWFDRFTAPAPDAVQAAVAGGSSRGKAGTAAGAL
jgi:hypothetical protein